MIAGRTAAFLQDAAIRTCSIELVTFLWNFRQGFPPHAYLAYTWRIHIVVLTQKMRFNKSDRSDFHMTDNLLIAVHVFASRMLMSFSVDRTLLPMEVKLTTDFRDTSFCVEVFPFFIKTWILFCLRSHGGKCLLMPVTDYAACIWLGRVYLPEDLCQQRSPRP